MKTLNNLCTKPWYRLLKVLYTLILIITTAIIYSTYVPTYDSFSSSVIEPIIIVLFILEILKRSIYYIYFGTIFPEKVEFETYISEIKNTIRDFKNEASEIPESTKRFLIGVLEQAQAEVDGFEKNKKDYERLRQIYELVDQVRHMYGAYRADITLINIYKIRALYYAQDLGLDISWVDIDL